MCGILGSHCRLALCLQDKWEGLRDLVQNMAASSKVSNQPAIYGQLAAADVLRIKGEAPAGISKGIVGMGTTSNGLSTSCAAIYSC